MPWISYPRVTHLFEIHTEACTQEVNEPEEEAEWKSKAFPLYDGIPLYCSTPCRMHLSPSTELFTMEQIQEEFPRVFIENSVPYMAARAAWEKKKGAPIERVGFWGCHMTGRAGVETDRASLLYWIGILEGMGVEVVEVPGSPLFMSQWTAGRYGVTCEQRLVDPRVMERDKPKESKIVR